jgi:hypothetical protein
MNNKNETNNNTSLEEEKKLSEKYVDCLPLRLIIQNIPYIGSSLDTVLSETGNKWREKRFQMLLQNFNEKIRAINTVNDEIISAMQKKIASEDFYDLFIKCVQKSVLTRKEEKIKRFANILKNVLVGDTLTENYLIEIFLNITDELTETEIGKLTMLRSNETEIYYNYRDKPFDIKRYINDVSERKVRIENDIPKEYNYDNFYMYTFNRLERLGLIKIEIVESSGGNFNVGWQNNNQSENSLKHYKRKDIISLSELGKNYIDWILK